MRIGLSIPSSHSWGTREAIAVIAKQADRSGLDSVWTTDELADHLRLCGKAGMDEMIVGFFSVDAEINLRQVRTFTDKVLPHVR